MASPIYTDRDSLAALAWTIAAAGRSEAQARLSIADVVTMVDQAVRRMCDEVWKAGQFVRFINDFNAVVLDASGSAALDTSIIPESVWPPRGVVYIPGDVTYPYPFDPIETLSDLYVPHGILGLCSFSVQGGNASGAMIYCVDHTGLAGGLASRTITVKAAQYYTFATVPEYLTHELVKVLAQMAREKMPGVSNGQQAS